MGMSGFAVAARSSEDIPVLLRRESFPLPATTPTKDTHANNSINNTDSLKSGLLVVVSVDPVATLQPLFDDDDAIEKAAWEMYPRMRKYVGFLRDVGSLQRPTSEENELEGEEPISTLFGTGVHLNLLHTQRPSRSRYDTIDESMCVPLCIERPASPSSNSSGSPSSSLSVTPQRQNSRRHPGLVRTNTRRPLPIQTTNGALPWRELYAHTIMDAFAAVSQVDDTPPRSGECSSFSISPKDMQRYDGYQIFDRARESSQYSKVQTNGVGAPGEYVDDWEEDEDEEDESQFRLSTVISGLTIEEDYSVADQPKDTPMSFAPSLRLPPSRVASPIGSGAAPSAWKGKPLRSSPQQQQQQQRPQQQDYMTAKEVISSPSLPEPPLSPKSPTMTGTSGETSESKNTIFSATSTPETFLSTHATTLPEQVFPPSPAPCEHEVTAAAAEEESQSSEPAPWNFSQIELGGGLGANKPPKRQCAIHVRVWLDLGVEDIREPEDPRTFFEELKMLRALERTSDMRYVAQQKQANAQRVLAWRTSTQSKPVKSASKSTLSLNNPFSTSHGKHLSSGGTTVRHNPFKNMRRTSMPSVSKSRKPSFLLTNSLHAPAFLLDRRRSSSALQGAATATAVLTVEHSNSMVSSLKRLWKRLVCRPTV